MSTSSAPPSSAPPPSAPSPVVPFDADRRSTSALDALPGPVLGLDDLRPGDVLLFCGSHPMSRSIRFFDDCLFDHVAFIAEPPTAEKLQAAGFPPVADTEANRGPWVLDMGFDGYRLYPLVDYEDPPHAVLVRRHRDERWRLPVSSYAYELAVATKGYSWERVLVLILLSLTNFSSKLKQNALAYAERHATDALSAAEYEQLVGRDPKVFLKNLGSILNAAEFELARSGPLRICVDLVHDAFDTSLHGTYAADDPYFGLVVPRRESNGLLGWAASGRTYFEYLLSGADADSAPDPYFDPDQLIAELFSHFNLGMTNRIVAEDDVEVSDDDLRQTTIEVTRRVLFLLGWRPGESGAAAPSPLALPAAAGYLLDQFLRLRLIVSQSDIAATKSLYDAGHLDVRSISWTRLDTADRT